jgi:hypothetical protein
VGGFIQDRHARVPQRNLDPDRRTDEDGDLLVGWYMERLLGGHHHRAIGENRVQDEIFRGLLISDSPYFRALRGFATIARDLDQE